MDVIRKDATITNTDDAFPGSFEVILSAPTKDRDGDTLLPRSGSSRSRSTSRSTSTTRCRCGHGRVRGSPTTSTRRALIVSGTYSSLPRAGGPHPRQGGAHQPHVGRVHVGEDAEGRQVDRDPRTPERRVRRDPLEPGSGHPVREGREGRRPELEADQEHLDAIARPRPRARRDSGRHGLERGRRRGKRSSP
jgi:hypothetical protein